jgi:hypothetical protein
MPTELPSTAWPCRVLHVEGQNEPNLEVDSSYFKDAIETLKTRKYTSMMIPVEINQSLENFVDIGGIEEPHAGVIGMSPDTALFSEILGEGNGHPDADFIDVSTAQSDGNYSSLMKIFNRDLHPNTMENLRRFEQDDYYLPTKACGEKDVSDLVGHKLIAS